MISLVTNFTNTFPDLGWYDIGSESIQARGPVDLVMALALIHHLAISNNVPLVDVARYFSNLGEYLIIEFVPKSGSQVKRLLASRHDIFPEYTVLSLQLLISSQRYTLQNERISPYNQIDLF